MLNIFIKYKLVELAIDIFFEQIDRNFAQLDQPTWLIDLLIVDEEGYELGKFDSKTLKLTTVNKTVCIDPLLIHAIDKSSDENKIEILLSALLDIIDETLDDILDEFREFDDYDFDDLDDD